MVLCASPGYLQGHGTPRHPADLGAHQVISYSYLSTKDEWHFTGPLGPVRVRAQPWMHTNNGETCRGADLASGALVELMPEYRASALDIHAVYPSRQHLPAKVRVLIDFLAHHLAGLEPSW
ncbi:MAG: hypothetical protein RJA36_3555 [Pseudomonadota bacterium]|jgi:DNA-binding transcriptional LysR family regulator